MNNPYARLFLAVRIWRKNDKKCFGGAAVLWGKDEDGIISVWNAVDFGTRELTASAKSGFELEDNESMLSRVESWTRPAPTSGHGDLRSELNAVDVASVGARPQHANQNWLLALPKADLLYKTSSSASTETLPHVLSLPAVQAIDDCRIDLHLFAAKVNSLNSS
jgi:hypothetical protein